MLQLIRIRDLAIIEDVTVELSDGLNVITGETGSGKSMLITALKLVLGGRASPESVRKGADRAEVEALFDIAALPRVKERIEALDIEVSDELILRRTISRAGRSRATLNGRLVTLSQLEDVAGALVEVCGQRASYGLVDRATHMAALDTFAELGPLRRKMTEAWQALQTARQALRTTESNLQNRGERQEFLRFQLREIEELDPQPGEDVELRGELDRLSHGELLAGAATEAEEALYSAENAICGALDRLEARLREAAQHDDRLLPLAQRMASCREELEDLGRDLGRYTEGVSRDPGRLDEIHSRLHALERFLRRHGPDVDALLARTEELRGELGELDGVEERLEEARQGVEDARRQAASVADELSTSRRKNADRLAKAVTDQLSDLGMGAARVEVEVTSGEDQDLSVTGIDNVEFLIAPNPGEEPRPLRKIASGGELSRALLALRCVLRAPCAQVFDEVDTGVGGGIAEVIGRKLATVAGEHQVLCITHLPQVAAQAHHHLQVRKWVDDGRTFVSVDRLDSEARREELARMLGGIELTDAARTAADDLLSRARPSPA